MADIPTVDLTKLNPTQAQTNPNLLANVNPNITAAPSNLAPVAIRQLDPMVGKVAPALFAAGSTTPLSVQDQNLVENWSKVKDLHDKLMAMPNAKAAKQFQLLQPNYQNALVQYYGVDYSTKPSNGQLVDQAEWQQQRTKAQQNQDTSLWGEAKNLVMSPFRAIMHGAEFYGKLFMTPIHAIENAAINNESFWSKKNWQAAFDGKMLYDDGELNKLTNQYSQETSYLATHILAGQTPGQIIQQYGPKSRAMLDEVNKLLNNPSEYAPILAQYERARLSPGRDAARWVMNAFGEDPVKDSGLFKAISGTLDAATTIFADPLTYLTMGGSTVLKGASTATKLAEKLVDTGDVAAHFADARVARFWNGYGKAIDELKTAKQSGDQVKAAEVSRYIQQNFAEHGTIPEQKTFLEAAKQVDGPFNFEDYWKKVDDISPLYRGAHAGILWAREGAAFSRATRESVLGMKQKAVEFFKGTPDFAKLDKEGFNNIVSQIKDNSIDRNVADDFIHQNAEKGLRSLVNRQTSFAPGSGAVNVTDTTYDAVGRVAGGAAKTIETFRRQAFVALNDRVMADTLAQHFLESTQAERINIKRFIDETTFRRFGVHNMGVEGQQLMDKLLGAKYGVADSFASRESMQVPEGFGTERAGQSVETVGPLAPQQFQDELRPFDWRKVQEFTAGKYKGTNPADESKMEKASRVVGGAYTNGVTNAITDIWSALTLIPQLGVRTAIDEGYQFAMYMNLPMLKNFFNVRRTKNVTQAMYGEKSGPAKELLLGALSKVTGKPLGASRFISAEERKALHDAALEEAAKNPNLSLRDAENAYRDQLYDMAIKKYGAKLPEQYKVYLKQMTDMNPRSMLDSTSSSHLTSSLTGHPEDGFKTDSGYFTDDHLNNAMDDHGLKATGWFRSERADSFTKTDLQLHMFRQLITNFNANSFEKYAFNDALKKNLDPMALFLKHNGLRPGTMDAQNAIKDFLKGFGVTDEGTILKSAETKVKQFVGSTTQFDKYQDLPDAEKLKYFAEDMFSNLYNIFHGDAGQFNQKLINYFKPFIDGKVGDHRILLNQMDFDTYKDLSINSLAKGRIFTDLDVPAPSFLETVRRAGLNGAYDLMARQTDNILRQPAVHLHYLFYRDQYAALEKQMANNIFKDSVASGWGKLNPDKAKAIAEDIAMKHFTQKAMNDAATHMLKFSDNPEMRSIFADNIRSVGRFYRAVEDFHRRTYRLVRDNGLGALYKMRLQSQGLNAVGNVHTDQNGDQYVIMPFDNIIYGAVNGVLQALDPNAKGVYQPTFDNITFKLAAGNPSFQNDAGMPYLSGPLGALSVIAAKALLGVPNLPITNKLSQNVDNFALGSYGDNVNLQKAFMPRIVQNLWNDLNPDEQSQQEVSALTQAISYNVANGINVPKLTDDKYKNIDGSVNSALFNQDKRDYLSQLRISAHNIVVMRGLLGMILPSTVQLSDTKMLPEYLKSNGLPSMQSSFYDVFDAIQQKHPDVQDPYELALTTWMGQNPNKIVYTLSKKNKQIVPIMKYSKQMEDWVVSNKQAVDQYGSGATLFAPQTGQFNPGTFNYMTAAGLTTNEDVKAFFDKALMQSAVNRYYDLNKEEQTGLMSIPFSDVNTRQVLIQAFKDKRTAMETAVPGLKEYISSGTSNKDALDFIENAHSFANEYSGQVDASIKEKINTAYDAYTQFIQYVNDIKSANYPNSKDLEQSAKIGLENQMQALIASDPTKVIEQYYNYGIKKIVNENVRDAPASVNRNY